MTQQREPTSQRHPQDILQERRALFQTIINDVSLSVFFRDHCGDVFQEIDSAIFANASLPLFVVTGRALITQGCVTAPAEPRDVACFTPTFRAVHGSILTERTPHARGLILSAARLLLLAVGPKVRRR